MANDLKIKKGYAAPLEGTGVRALLGLAFFAIGIKMLASLGNSLGMAMGMNRTPVPGAPKLNAPTITSGIRAPKPPTHM